MTHESDSLLIYNAQVMTPDTVLNQGWVFCKDGVIAGVGSGLPPRQPALSVNAGGQWLLPGFIDIHVHGANGYDTMDATAESLAGMARFYAQHGVTAFLATTWTDTRQRISAAVDAVRAHLGAQAGGATLLGVHLEGPYLNPAKCGAQNLANIRRADRAEALAWLDSGVVRLLSLAPEYPENHWLIEECARRGVTVSMAHTSATYDDVCHAVTLGLRHATHTFNAMNGLHHREPGGVGGALAEPRILCELIADNIHVHPATMAILWRVKGRDGVTLISDSVRVAGLPDGIYRLDDREVYVCDGAVRLSDGTLAGSSLTMERALWNFMEATGEPLARVWQTASLNPARAIGVADRKGSIQPGKDADLALLGEGGEVLLTVAEGRIVHRGSGLIADEERRQPDAD